MRKVIVFVFILLFPFTGLAAATRNNDDTCDIATLPAATLLLPYFEISQDGTTTTLFTITNTSPKESIARVRLWTDYSYEVIEFNVYLTGYDVQSINLWDVIFDGVIGSDRGTGGDISPKGEYSTTNSDIDVSDCDDLPGVIPDVYKVRMQQAFMSGKVPAFGSFPGCNSIGAEHPNAVGYATIDVVNTCNCFYFADCFRQSFAFDNVLLGDYQQVERHAEVNYSEGGSMVHIRAIPEGDVPAETQSPFARTFYSRYMPASTPTFDRRQPLPSVFAARWIGGSASNYETDYKVWREPTVNAGADCASYEKNLATITDFVLFDEDENATGFSPESLADPPGCCTPRLFPSTKRESLRNAEFFPHNSTGAVSGWMYLNLDDQKNTGTSANQAWVVVNLRSGKDLSVDLDAAPLGNGCSPRIGKTEVLDGSGGAVIGPAANVNP